MSNTSRNSIQIIARPWAIALAVAALGSAPVLSDNGTGGRPCNAATIKGDYGIQMQGTRNTPPPTVVNESVIGVVMRRFDGYGGFEQVDNIKGAVSGIVPDRPGTGTYEVNPDCTGSTYFQPDPNNPNLVIRERMVIVHDGGEIRAITQTPATLMVSAVATRVQKR